MSEKLVHIVSHPAALKFLDKSADEVQRLLIRNKVFLDFVPKHYALYAMKYSPQSYKIQSISGEKVFYSQAFYDQQSSFDGLIKCIQAYVNQEEPPHLLITYPEAAKNLEKILNGNSYATQMLI